MSVCLYEFTAADDEPELCLMASDYDAESLWLADDDGAVYFSRRQGQQLLRALLVIYGETP